MENLGVRLQNVPSYAEQSMSENVRKRRRSSAPKIFVKIPGAINERERLEIFHSIAEQMFALSVRNARTGKSKQGELTMVQGDSLYKTYHRLVGGKHINGLEIDNNNHRKNYILDALCAAKKEKSESSTNISLNEQEEILYALALDLEIDLDEVTEALNNRDEQLAKASKKMNFNA